MRGCSKLALEYHLTSQRVQGWFPSKVERLWCYKVLNPRAVPNLQPPPPDMGTAMMAAVRQAILVFLLVGILGNHAFARMACDQGSCRTGRCYCISSRFGDCIRPNWICDGTDDCDNGEDELNCDVTTTSGRSVCCSSISHSVAIPSTYVFTIIG